MCSRLTHPAARLTPPDGRLSFFNTTCASAILLPPPLEPVLSGSTQPQLLAQLPRPKTQESYLISFFLSLPKSNSPASPRALPSKYIQNLFTSYHFDGYHQATITSHLGFCSSHPTLFSGSTLDLPESFLHTVARVKFQNHKSDCITALLKGFQWLFI